MTHMEKIKIIFDTDIGDDIDDAFALALALNSPELEILGITTVYKNVSLRAKIAKNIVRLSGADIKVYEGEDLPYSEPIKLFDFEKCGTDGRPVIAHYMPEMSEEIIEKTPAVEYILNTIAEHPGEVVLLALGPLTNVARAIERDPGTFSKIKALHIMGGSLFDARCEWNFRCDPEAAAIVFDTDVKKMLYGLDVTCECKMSPDDIAYFLGLKAPKNIVLSRMLGVWMSNAGTNIPTMHDPLATACLFNELCEYADLPIEIDEKGNRGFTRVLCGRLTKQPKAKTAINIDSATFMTFLRERVCD